MSFTFTVIFAIFCHEISTTNIRISRQNGGDHHCKGTDTLTREGSPKKNSKFHIMPRLAAEQDLEWISAIQSKCGLPQCKPNSTTWVLEKKAFAIWQTAGDECELLSIAVERAERGKGWAKILMEHCRRELIAQGFEKFFLEVRESNTAAISLYKKFGYEKIGERKKYYSNGETAVLMRQTPPHCNLQ